MIFQDIVVRPLFDSESSTHTYLLYEKKSRASVMIDPVLEQVERDTQLIRELDLNLVYTLETHVHADHITGATKLKQALGAKIALSACSNVDCADLLLEDGEELHFGEQTIKALHTPGHTDTCTSYLIPGAVFTGDTLFIRGTGRTDFQSGSSETLFNSVWEKIFTLPDETIIFPGHDYKGMLFSTVLEEKKYNPRLAEGQSVESFIQIMDGLNLANPKKLHLAVPANMKCGNVDSP